MVTLTSNADEVQALLELIQRAPLTRAEALYVESVFARWFEAIKAGAPANNTAPLGSGGGDQRRDQPAEAVPASPTLTKGTDQL